MKGQMSDLHGDQSDSKSGGESKRPALVWIIFFFVMVSTGWSLLSLAIIHFNLIPLDDQTKAYFESQSWFDVLYSVVIGLLNIGGTVMLFLMRKQAVKFLLLGFVISIGSVVYQTVFKNWLAVVGIPGAIGAFIGYCISLAIILYAKSLLDKGMLR
ncbi:MAG: hypothetical protein KDD43_02320 [Bdellovibrionales bacterium]|nr:hypothetical protein [Bdellovibrionales bacterium]